MQAPELPIVRRRVRIDFDSSRAGDWSGRSKAFENALNAVSFILPAGETFFMNSVRNYMDRIGDPVLREQVDRFIFQEGMHCKEHTRSNTVLKQTHPFGSEMEKLSGFLLSLGRRFTPKATQLATSCALEHFTGMLADLFLADQHRIMEEMDPGFATLWMWHAAEETEHKAVCFDVYQHVVGKGFFANLHRTVIMFTTSLVGLFALAAGFAMVKWKQRKLPKTAEAQAPRISMLLKDIPFRMYLDYYRFSFHPWDHDNRHLVDEWKCRNADFGLTR